MTRFPQVIKEAKRDERHVAEEWSATNSMPVLRLIIADEGPWSPAKVLLGHMSSSAPKNRR